MNSSESVHQNSEHSIAIWITLIRGVLVIVLGLSLLVIPEKTGKSLFNFMGVFWLMSGIVSIRQETHTHGDRLSLAAAVIGVLAGVLVITRGLTRQWLAEIWVVDVLGLVILLTGVLHAVTGFRFARQALRGRTLLSTLLGVAEIVFGALLLLAPTGREPIVYDIAIIWALLGGSLLLLTAIYQWLQMRRQA